MCQIRNVYTFWILLLGAKILQSPVPFSEAMSGEENSVGSEDESLMSAACLLSEEAEVLCEF